VHVERRRDNDGVDVLAREQLAVILDPDRFVLRQFEGVLKVDVVDIAQSHATPAVELVEVLDMVLARPPVPIIAY